MDRLGVPLARAESVADVVFEAKSVTRANQVESEWNINSNLDRDQQAALLELLVEYSDVFATPRSEYRSSGPRKGVVTILLVVLPLFLISILYRNYN